MPISMINDQCSMINKKRVKFGVRLEFCEFGIRVENFYKRAKVDHCSLFIEMRYTA